jgi:endonuclease YncB( thermonuclease family)
MTRRLLSLWSHRFMITPALLSIAFLATADGYGQRRSVDHAGCQFTSGGESTVMSVVGPQTLHLADGRFVRLAEVLTPAAAPGTGFDPALAATAYLRSKTLGRKVEIKFGGNPRDRYGVATAHAFVAGEPALWLQEGLVASGLALAFPQADNSACSQRLAAFEAEARNEKRGNWGLALFKVLPAKETRAINNLVQTYQIVEGKVDHITRTGSRVLIHFGEENKFGFTALVEPAAQKRSAESVDLLPGRTIRVRGWIEHKRGPSLTISLPEQIELVDESIPSTKAQ